MHDVERHYNLSRHSGIRHLELTVSHETEELSWLCPITSLANSEHLQSLTVYLSSEGDDIEGLVRQLDDSPVLIQLDDILQEERFARIETFEVYMVASSQAPNEHFLGEEEVWGQWAELMRRKMPMSDKRGILRYAVRTILRHVYLTQQQCSYFNRVEIGVSAPP